MYPFTRARVIKHCAEGHVMRMDWLTCPRCTGEAAERVEVHRESSSSGRPLAGIAPRTVRREDSSEVPAREAPKTTSQPPKLPPSARAQWSLVGFEGAAKGRRIALSDERIKLGKAPAPEAGARIEVLEDQYMSREHMVIERRGEGWILRDVGSRNGTAVNDTRVDEHLLRPGDVIRAGHLALRVEIGQQEAET
jgi:hypothetical protein